ncbi:hypothetical protein SEPCBS57363_002228 [Sporothrix epigloea]|uniref:SprT-like domain-containing protein n=1 Tax=Sporothrix epigloea TaxID=1892477 RepID=A0ABP0DHE8_9PEZI
MRHRRVIIDSDDDIDDFPSLRPASPTPVPTTTGPANTPKLVRPQFRAPEKTPKQSKSRVADIAAAPTTTIRRRKLGRINNDATLLQLPADDKGELSTEEASVLEHVDIEGEDNVESVSDYQDTSKVKVEHDKKQPSCQEKECISNSNYELYDEDEENSGEEIPSAIGMNENDNSSSDNVSDASEFRASSVCSDSSFDSLGDYFARSPTRRPAAAKDKDLRVRTERNASSPIPESAASTYADEESSVFFSAEESFSKYHPVTGPEPHKRRQETENQAQTSSKPTNSRTKTPPLELPHQSRASRLTSPTKKLPRIPQTPHRPSTDEFWNQLVVDDWNTEHSPRKLLFDTSGASVVKKSKASSDGAALETTALSTALKKGKTVAATTTKDAKKVFQNSKHEMAEKFLAELDNTITDGQLSSLAAATGGVQILWTNKLNTTAGRANWRRETLRPKYATPSTQAEHGTGSDTSNTATTAARVHHHASIELAEKVIDDEHRLLNVIAHEFCHLANFMVSGITGNPHGKEFKAWAAKCSRQFGSRGIQVTTKHAYEIDFKYVWTCDACATEFKRHSKSIDPARHRCGACKGALRQTKPVPRGGGAKGASGAGAGVGGSAPTAGPSEYQKFMKEHMAIVRRENPNSPQKIIMTLVADKWTRAKEHKKAASSLATGISQSEAGNDEAGACVDSLGKSLVDLNLG